MGRWRIKLFFDVGIQVLCPIYLPDIPRREWNQRLEEEQEGGEGILFDFVPGFPPPIPGSGSPLEKCWLPMIPRIAKQSDPELAKKLQSVWMGL